MSTTVGSDEQVDPAAGERLTRILMEDDCVSGLWASIESGEMDHLVPELPALRMEQDPIHRHKDVLSHTVAVVAKTDPEITVRLAALFPSPGPGRSSTAGGRSATTRWWAPA